MSNFDPTVAFSDNEHGSTNKLNKLVANDNALFSMIPHTMFRAGTGDADVDFSESQSRVFKPVMFFGKQFMNIRGRFGTSRVIDFPAGTFAASCTPIVMTQVVGYGHERTAFSTVEGLSGGKDVTSGGFRVWVYHRDQEKFQTNINIHYIALGWQEA